MQEEESREDRAIAHLKLAAELASLVYAIWLIWIMIPEHQRRLMIMRGMEGIRRLAARLACHTGRQGIGLEARTGIENYVLPYGFSLLREACADAYERLRYS